MKWLTKESVATTFQIAVIIFIFLYSFPSPKNTGALNTNAPGEKISADSPATYPQLQKSVTDAAALDTHYAGVKKTGLLYNHLNIQAAFFFNANMPGRKGRVAVNNILTDTISGTISSLKGATGSDGTATLFKKTNEKY